MQQTRTIRKSCLQWHLVAYGLIACSTAFSNPTDPVVKSGTASFEKTDARTLSIITSDKAIIHWNDFSIADGELTQFLQPSSNSVVVNKVTSDLSSVLLGSLKANGNVYLLNPNGILIGENGSIDTNSFIASTLHACSHKIINGYEEILFKGASTAKIVNLGTVNAWDGDVVLIGYQIENPGAIDAPNGTVAVGAGQNVLLQPLSTEKIIIRPSLEKYENDLTGIDSSGAINACRAELKADGNAYSMAIHHKGAIDAMGTYERNGEVFLIAENGNNGIYGSISAKNANDTGGSVQVLGAHIALLEDAYVDASGSLGGGSIMIGGDQNGANPDITNAETTYISEKVKIDASAKLEGDGGKVIIWSDDTTCFYGSINVGGGENLGDGGFVEVSGKQSLCFNGTTNRLAPNGNAGMLLLDPLDITISTAANTNNTGASPFAPTAAPSNLNTATLIAALGGGSVTVQSATGGVSTGNITLLNNLNYNSSNTLTLTTNIPGITQGDIIINANIFNLGTGGIILDSSNNIFINDARIDNFNNSSITNLYAQRGDIVFTSVNASSGMQPYTNLYAFKDIKFLASNNQILVLNNSYPATITAVTGNLILQGGTAATSNVAVSGGPLAVSVPIGHVELIGGSGATSSRAELIGSGLDFNFNCGGHLYITGGNQGFASLASLRNLLGTFNVNMSGLVGPDAGKIILTGTTSPGAGLNAELYSFDSINVTTPTEVILNGAPSSFVDTLIATRFGNININADRVILNGNNSPNSVYIQTERANITIQTGHDFSMNNGCWVEINSFGVPTPPHDILIIANTNITVGSGANIQNFIPGGAVTLVVDNFYPIPPLLGNGAFTNQGRITTATGGPLRVFTSRRPLNTQTGLLNGGPFTPGPIYVNSNLEEWYVWYFNSFNGFPYTIFYKDLPGPIVPILPTTSQLATGTTLFNTAAYEFLQNLKDYDVFWYWRTTFNSDYDHAEYSKLRANQGLSTSDVVGKSTYRLLRKSYKEQNGKVVYLLK